MKRQIIVTGEVARVPLSQGFFALIDAADVALIEGWDWSVMHSARTSYARRNDWCGGRQKSVLLHRVIFGADDDVRVDHRSGDGLDCRRDNLRAATYQQNNLNTRMHSDNRCGFKGVRQHSPRCFSAQIQSGGIRRYLGAFETAEAAHAAYCAASAIYHHEFGRTE